jgi:molybdopterin molybdotransferase
MMRFPEARQSVLEKIGAARRLPEAEGVPLRLAAGRVLAEAVLADRDYPPFNRSTRDGYAVRVADLAPVPRELRVIGEVRAGSAFEGEVGPGQCVAIMTGAPLPRGADAVVMLEYTEQTPHVAANFSSPSPGSNRTERGELEFAAAYVRVNRAVKPGENIVPRGSEARSGTQVLAAGRRLGYPEIAALASVGRDPVSVFRRPRIAILPTGDEVVEVGCDPLPWQIRNSNSYSLCVQVEQAGGLACPLGIAPDEPEALRRMIERGLQHDLLLLSGGVSMGKYDLVEDVLRELGAEFFFNAVAIQPGRPLMFGYVRAATASDGAATASDRAATESDRAATEVPMESGREGAVPRGSAGGRRDASAPYEAIRRFCGLPEGAVTPGVTFFFGLPGNPLSTMVTFELFARPAVELLAGMEPPPLVFLRARLAKPVRHKPGLTRFLPAVLAPSETPRSGSASFEPEVRLVEWQGSGDVASLARSNCYLVVPDDREELPAGEMAGVLPRQY